MVMDAQSISLPEPPVPRDVRTQVRWDHTRLRRRILYREWRRDIEERLRVEIGHIRKAAWGVADLSANVFISVTTQLAVLYDRPPTVRAPGGGDAFLAEVERAGWWTLAQRVQRDTLGLREMFVHVSVVDGEDGPELQFRPVFPDLVEAHATPERPEEPVHLFEAVLRTVDGRKVWTWEEWNIRDREAPSFRVWDADRKVELSAELGLGGLVGEGYTWRTEDGTPILPFVCYHASKTGQLFDHLEGLELVEGALNIAVMWTQLRHAVKNCSWPQRYVVGAKLVGAQVSDDEDEADARREVVVDPAVVLEFIADDASAGSIQIGAFPTAANPLELQETVALYERRVAASGGVSPSDVMRVAGDPRSGYALAISAEGQRAAARRFEPEFRRADERLLRVAALLWVLKTDSAIPTAGYRVSYAAIPPSPEEQQAERKHLLELLDRGLLSRLEVYRRLNPGTTDEDAKTALAKIAELNSAGNAAASPFANVGLPALVSAGIIGASAARKLLGVGEDAAPTPTELAALKTSSPGAGGDPPGATT